MESSIQNSNPEPQQILKRKTKNSKLIQAKSIYICECSKIYLSFPALYLHVKNKHNTKLTSRIDDQVCRMEQKNGKTYFTFFYSQSCPDNNQQQDLNFQKEFRNQKCCVKTGSQQEGSIGNQKDKDFDSYETQKESQKKKSNSDVLDVGSLIQTYLQTPKMIYSGRINSAKAVLVNFIEYIEKSAMISKQFQKMKTGQPKMMVECLPLFFNEFLIYYLPENLQSCDYNGINKNGQIQVMKMFANWLREHKFTNLIVLDNL